MYCLSKFLKTPRRTYESIPLQYEYLLRAEATRPESKEDL